VSASTASNADPGGGSRDVDAFGAFALRPRGYLGSDDDQAREGLAIEVWVAANALMGVHRALVAHVRSRVTDGAPHGVIAGELRAHGGAALQLLARGITGT
jgi:hypothetical protein